jgi:TonB family protein
MQKYWLATLALLLSTALVQAQTPKATAVSNTTVYTYVEEMPELPEGGGMGGIVTYFFRHFQLSAREAKDFMGGSVYLEFVVNEAGDATHARITRSGGRSIDAAALRVIQSMPCFHPGRQKGVPVKVKLTIPISCIKPQ